MPIYNKLVHDSIPLLLSQQENNVQTRIIDEEKYKKELIKKLKEESEEYFSSQSSEEAVEEIADILEVIRALAIVHGVNWEQLEAIRKKRINAWRIPEEDVPH